MVACWSYAVILTQHNARSRENKTYGRVPGPGYLTRNNRSTGKRLPGGAPAPSELRSSFIIQVDFTPADEGPAGKARKEEPRERRQPIAGNHGAQCRDEK